MDFVPLSDVFSRLVAYYAFHKIAERPEGITADDIESVASYCDKLASYEERLRLQRRAKARGGVSAPTNQNSSLSRDGAVEPRKPDCPAIVRHFLNILVIRGESIDTSRRVISRYVTTGRFPSYVLSETGLAARLKPRIFKNNRYNAHSPFRVRISAFDQETPVHVLEADLEYFVEHGRLKSEDPAPAVEQGETGPIPPDTATGGVEDRNDERPEDTPPYLAFMLRAAREMGLGPGTRTPKKTIEAWLRENWPDQLGELSERKIKNMATSLRHPKDERGGYFKPNRDE